MAARIRLDDSIDPQGLAALSMEEKILGFAETLLYYHRATGDIPERVSLTDLAKRKFDEYLAALSVSDDLRNFFAIRITDLFQSDELYSFCDELFSD